MVEIGENKRASVEEALLHQGWRKTISGEPSEGFREYFFERSS
jgi:hypothetical protein